MRIKASGECRIAFYAAKAVRDGFKRKVEPAAKFLRSNEVIKMKITNRTVFFVLVVECTKLFGFFFYFMVLVRMLMTKRVKRLIGNSELH